MLWCFLLSVITVMLCPALQSYSTTSSGDVMISYLPLAHMFERMVEVHMNTDTPRPLLSPVCVCVVCVCVYHPVGYHSMYFQ